MARETQLIYKVRGSFHCHKNLLAQYTGQSESIISDPIFSKSMEQVQLMQLFNLKFEELTLRRNSQPETKYNQCHYGVILIKLSQAIRCQIEWLQK